jgi:4-methyl-5(b-hydroxyethyl)-thiazole monophosphate biosynthesis
VDILRRGGVDVTLAGLSDGILSLSRQVKVLPDTTLDAVLGLSFDAMLIPGGAGHKAMMEDARVMALLQRHAQTGAIIASICAGPKVLAKAGLLKGKRATSYPGALAGLYDSSITLVEGEAVVVDGQVITSKGPGTTLAWALQVLKALEGKEIRDKVQAALQC